MKKLPAHLTICKQTGPGDDKVTITLVDKGSGCVITEAIMSLEDWAKATFSSMVEVEVNLNTSRVIGKQHEHKTELITMKDKDGKTLSFEQLVEEALVYEDDYWRMRKNDLKNHHNWVGTSQIRVTFDRYVDVEE
tara:strand:+ start:1115 stop:1519 length:405 start_codon:yes stop_codon:yes gene_type:complete